MKIKAEISLDFEYEYNPKIKQYTGWLEKFPSVIASSNSLDGLELELKISLEVHLIYLLKKNENRRVESIKKSNKKIRS